MQKPQAIEYETSYKKVILSDPKQLVVKQGAKCINAGTVKVKGKFSPFFVRYDNKPELAAEITTWLEACKQYDEWVADQVAITKDAIIIKNGNTKDFDEAESVDFAWSYWDGTSGKTLVEISTGREIYQMRYTDNGSPVEGKVKAKVMMFWRALEELKNEPARLRTRRDPPGKQG